LEAGGGGADHASALIKQFGPGCWRISRVPEFVKN
jgi:hypothetical protein